MITVAAVVVTRNRPALLKRCLEAINAQTYAIRQLVVVDNASDEPTREFLAGETGRRGGDFHLVRLEENTGGAGGLVGLGGGVGCVPAASVVITSVTKL